MSIAEAARKAGLSEATLDEIVDAISELIDAQVKATVALRVAALEAECKALREQMAKQAPARARSLEWETA